MFASLTFTILSLLDVIPPGIQYQ